MLRYHRWLKITFFFIIIVGVFGLFWFLKTTVKDGNSKKSFETKIILDTKELNVSNFSTYKVLTSSGEVPITSSILYLSNEESDIVTVVNEIDRPILMGRKFKGDTNIELSLKSSAYMMVLMHPIFNGKISDNPKELQRRIQEHPKFYLIILKIKMAINKGSLDPLDPIMNYDAFNIVEELVSTLKIDDLYTGENE